MLTARKAQRLWREFNASVFDGKLKRIKIVIGYTEPEIWGLCYDSRLIVISDTITDEQATSTLLHEMIHQWQFENGLTMHHGNSFSKWRKVCLQRTGLSV